MRGLHQGPVQHHWRPILRRFPFLLAIAPLLLSAPALADDPQDPPLVRLPPYITSPLTVYQGGRGSSKHRKLNLGGWLALNGAQFRREEFPDLARHLDFEKYHQGIEIDPESEFVSLPDYPHEIADDRLVEGMAICPAEPCRVGRMMPFNLEPSR